MDFANYWFSSGESGGAAEVIGDSLRFRGAQRFTRSVPAAGDKANFTISVWAKHNVDQNIFFQQQTNANGYASTFGIRNTNKAQAGNLSNFVGPQPTSTALFRDSSAWYHCLLNYGTNGMAIFINGVQVAIATSKAGAVMNSAGTYIIGGTGSSASYGYMAEYNFIDGQTLDPTSFGEYNSDGVWVPIKYEGTYGTNGFHLTFDPTQDDDPAVGIGIDSSGNGNNFTSSGFEVTDTNSYEYDSMVDSPSQNFSILNPVAPNGRSPSAPTEYPQDGNLYASSDRGSTEYTPFFYPTSIYELPKTGKWFQGIFNTGSSITSDRYFGYQLVGSQTDAFANSNVRLPATGYTITMRYGSNHYIYISINGTEYFSEITEAQAGDSQPQGTIVLAYDAGTGNVWWGYVLYGPENANYTGNIVWLTDEGVADGSANPETGTNPAFNVSDVSTTGQLFFRPFINRRNVGQSGNVNSNLYLLDGNSVFSGNACTPPAGYETLSAVSLPNAPITAGTDGFRALTGPGADILAIAQGSNTTGTNWNPTINTGFTNGLWWIKGLDSSNQWQWVDSVRGSNLAVKSPNSTAETAFVDPTGNAVAWCWKTGAAVSNTEGDLTADVAANTGTGFSIVHYNGNAAATATVSHGLNEAPDVVWITNTDNPNAYAWRTYWSAIFPTTGNTQNLTLNTSEAAYSTTQLVDGVSDTLVTLTGGSSSTLNYVNGPASTDYIMYCWHAVPGYSAFGSYTGNNSTNGPFIYTGFRPAFVLIKTYQNSDSWIVEDSTRSTFNPNNQVLSPNSTNAETVQNGNSIDFLSNGFKCKGTDGSSNANSNYIYMAFAESPFGGSNVAPANAR